MIEHSSLTSPQEVNEHILYLCSAIRVAKMDRLKSISLIKAELEMRLPFGWIASDVTLDVVSNTVLVQMKINNVQMPLSKPYEVKIPVGGDKWWSA